MRFIADDYQDIAQRLDKLRGEEKFKPVSPPLTSSPGVRKKPAQCSVCGGTGMDKIRMGICRTCNGDGQLE